MELELKRSKRIQLRHLGWLAMGASVLGVTAVIWMILIRYYNFFIWYI